jgi:hypothetical protein
VSAPTIRAALERLRAATLLQQASPAPAVVAVPVAERLPEPSSGASLPLLSNQPRVWEPLPGAE